MGAVFGGLFRELINCTIRTRNTFHESRTGREDRPILSYDTAYVSQRDRETGTNIKSELSTWQLKVERMNFLAKASFPDQVVIPRDSGGAESEICN